jgi:hypothetical protein
LGGSNSTWSPYFTVIDLKYTFKTVVYIKFEHALNLNVYACEKGCNCVIYGWITFRGVVQKYQAAKIIIFFLLLQRIIDNSGMCHTVLKTGQLQIAPKHLHQILVLAIVFLKSLVNS